MGSLADLNLEGVILEGHQHILFKIARSLCSKDESLRLVQVVGEAGIGKSCLVRAVMKGQVMRGLVRGGFLVVDAHAICLCDSLIKLIVASVDKETRQKRQNESK